MITFHIGLYVSDIFRTISLENDFKTLAGSARDTKVGPTKKSKMQCMGPLKGRCLLLEGWQGLTPCKAQIGLVQLAMQLRIPERQLCKRNYRPNAHTPQSAHPAATRP
jgi:hypothetical protein